MQKRYYSANQYFLEKFGQKVYKLALDGGMTCPNRDGSLGKMGCIFCSAGGSGDFAIKRCESVEKQIENAKNLLKNKRTGNKFIAYFQSYTNTYASVEYLRKLFLPVVELPEICALSIATRPDCLPDGVVELLSEINKLKPVFIELGLQTIHNKTAQFIRRGYDLPVFDDAVKRLKNEGINVIAHLILGLPGETKQMMLDSVNHVAKMGIDGVKLQLLHVLEGTDLAEIYKKGEFSTLSLDEYADIIADCIRALPPNVVVHRITGDAPKRLLLAPTWSADKKRVLNHLNAYFDKINLKQSENS